MKRIPTRALISGMLAVTVLVIAAASSLAGDAAERSEGRGDDAGLSVPGSSGSGSTGSSDPGTGVTGGGDGSLGMCVAPTGPTGPDTPVCNDVISGPGLDAPDPGPQVVEPTPGMAGVRARPFDSATIGDDDRTVTIDFVSGIEPCYVLDRVEVEYGPGAVTITLFEGHDAGAGDVACIEIGVFKRVMVTLDEPLAGRDIVDGAAA